MTMSFVRVIAAVAVLQAAAAAQIGQITNAGHVVNEQGQPLKNAMITYTGPDKRLNYAFSDANGNFGNATAVQRPSGAGEAIRGVAINGSSLRFYLDEPKQVTVDFFTVNGRRSATVMDGVLGKGAYAIDLGRSARLRPARDVYFVKIKLGNACVIRRFVTIAGATPLQASDIPSSDNVTSAAAAKRAAAVDTLRVGKTGYKPVYLPLNNLTDPVGTVTLVKINIEARIDSVLATLSLANKVILMTQDNPDANNPYKCGTGIYNAGVAPDANGFNSWNNARMATGMKIPSISGYDCVHGYIGGGSVEGTMFPHNQAMGCIQDTLLIQKAGRVTAIESASRGVYWAFAPCVAVVRNEHWGRIYEGCGETPDICARVARNLILGMQGRDLSLNTAIVATAKHFAGDGGSQGGVNPGNTVGTDAALRAIHLPPYTAAIEAEVGCIMPSFSSWNGVGSHANKPLLTDWLKTQQGFDGYTVGDWQAHTFQGGSDRQSCVNACINAGLDNPMSPGIGPQTESDLTAGNASGAIPIDRINDACRRILRILFRKGLFENWHALAGYDSYFHSDLHRQAARQCVAASMVVLKNTGSTLPLKKTGQKIAVIGMWGNDIGLQCGGWTLGWQGAEGAQTPHGTSLYQSLQSQGSGNTVTYSADGSSIASDANVVVVCVGINPAAEYTKTDAQLQLIDSQYGKISDLMGKATASGKPIVLVLFVDGPAVVTNYINQSQAVACAWLGSPEGAGFGDILYGDVHPSGKLNHTWPSTLSQIPINDGNMGDAVGSGGSPLYPVGYGLTY